MNDYDRNLESAGEHIWLRYATQFTTGGRSHTIEMSVPLPIGANDETREQLLREAEKGLSHLISHVETRMPQILQRTQTQNVPVVSAPANKLPASRSVSKLAAVPAPPTSTQSFSANSPQVREPKNEVVKEEAQKDAPRASGVSMPSMPGGGNGSISIPEFIQAIKGLGLNPRQAMDLLKVKSLATGLNLREALDRLQYLIAQDVGDMPDAELQGRETRSSVVTSTAHNGVSSNNSVSSAGGEEEDAYGNAPIPIFNEEVDPEEEEDFVEPLDEFSQPLSASERNRAGAIIDKLRESRGATVASPGRLQVLHNVIGDQISEEQLQALMRGLWGITQLKKLKVDQVESLIYWAKEDDFVNEVDAVLMLIEEEG